MPSCVGVCVSGLMPRWHRNRHRRKMTSIMNAGVSIFETMRTVHHRSPLYQRRAANGDTHRMSIVDHLHRAPRGLVQNTERRNRFPNPAG
jgi:hypothetical protein